MANSATTLSGAINATQYTFGVASTTGITAPNNPTGVGNTLLYVDSELMFVNAVNTNTNVVTVTRGYGGTVAASHLTTSPVIAGPASGFPNFIPESAAFTAKSSKYDGIAGPVASAATITASGKLFHVTGNTQTTTILPPANFLEGMITIIPDGVWTWTTGGTSPWAIAVAGTVTSALSTVSFIYDAKTLLWYPSRLV